MDGYELGRRLRAVAPELPVICHHRLGPGQRAPRPRGRLLGRAHEASGALAPGRRRAKARRRAPPRSQQAGRTVLLVDDDPTQRKLAQLALTSAGFAVTPAESGDAALLLAAIHPPDVIVSDVLMPRMDGFSLCREVRRDRHLSRVPIVLMSAHYVETEDRDLAAGFGATRYVSRTGGFDVVVGAVVDAMELPVSDGEGSRGTRRSSALNRGAAANLK